MRPESFKAERELVRQRHTLPDERGFALFYLAAFLTLLLIFVGLAVDTWRAFVVQAQLSKAVDGAAVGAARMLNSGSPQQEAANIYNANFPNGWMGTLSSTRPGEAGFFTMTTDPTTGVKFVDVRATAVVPTRFMKLANFQELRVTALGEATRRMVDVPCADVNPNNDGSVNTDTGASAPQVTAQPFPWNCTSTQPQCRECR